MLLGEEDIIQALSTAQTDFLDALAEGPEAVLTFQTRWGVLRASIDSDLPLQPSTLELSDRVSYAIADLAEVLLTQEANNKAIEDDLSNDLVAQFHQYEAFEALEFSENDCEWQENMPPVPPFIGACYEWLLQHLHNPYPSNEGRLTPPSSPRSACSILPSLKPALDTCKTFDDIDRWFSAARIRIGWTHICDTKFGGDKAMMLEAARVMWGSSDEEYEERNFAAGCVSRRSVSPKREEIPSYLKSPHDSIAFQARLPEAHEEPAERHCTPPREPPCLDPDVELAFACMETRAHEMYAHRLEPSELVDTLSASALPREAVNDVECQEAIARAAHEKRQQARREQRQAKNERDAAQMREEQRASYPSPEPSSDDEGEDEDDEESTDAYDSEASDSEDDSDSDTDSHYSQPFASYARGRTSFLSDVSALADDEDEASDDDEDDNVEGDDESEEEEEEEDTTPPPKLAGSKRRADEDIDGQAEEKRLRSASVPHFMYPPSPKSPMVVKRAAHKRPTRRASPSLIRLSPPPAPVTMGPDGVPLGTVPSKTTKAPASTSTTKSSTVQVHIPLPAPSSRSIPSSGIKVTGDPTPWVNWDLNAAVPCGQSKAEYLDSVGSSRPQRRASTSSSSSTSSSLSRTPSLTSLSSLSSGSSVSTCETVGTDSSEPAVHVQASETATEAPIKSAAHVHPLFNPDVWSQYNLDATADVEFHRGKGRKASSFRPAKLLVEAVDLSTSPSQHWTPSVRSRTRLAPSVAAPVTSYHHAAGTVTSPIESSFGQGQLTSILSTGPKAGITRRQTPPAKRRVSPRAQEPVEPSSLVDDIISSGLVVVCKEITPVKAPKKDRRYAERAERRASKANSFDSPDTVRARLAEIEQEAARLEAERLSLQRIASVGG
uniref:Mating-type protein A-alpha Z3 n=1 Tax=Schizophyllum commune TaxID=5334 RepID=MAAZ3_SCHCO|nr:RecName: Full=Mating-type protein A-alpha Z3 [Schizophyllum commune]AAB01369.1 A-alpha Z3 protein [Schizophyllum commune]